MVLNAHFNGELKKTKQLPRIFIGLKGSERMRAPQSRIIKT